MLSVSERIIKRLSELNADESAHLKSAVDQHFIAACTLPPLVGSKGVECKIAVTAPVSAGKSTLFNALCGYPILPVASKTTSAAPTLHIACSKAVARGSNGIRAQKGSEQHRRAYVDSFYSYGGDETELSRVSDYK